MSYLVHRAVTPVLACLLLVTGGCASLRSPTPNMPPPAASMPPPEPTPGERLVQADALLATPDLHAAAIELQLLLEAHPSSAEAPQALFQLAVVYLAPDSPLHDASQGITLLRNLVEAYPTSPWRLGADAILMLAGTNADLRQAAAELQGQLDTLKQIDADAILKLAGTNADLRQVAAALQEQLDKLKQIDIGPDG